MTDRRKSTSSTALTSDTLKTFNAPQGPEVVWDSFIAGFGLRTRRQSRPEAWRWVYVYRHKARQVQVTLTLGSALMFTAEEARRWAKDAAKRANTSDDLFDAKQNERAAHEAEKAKPTVRELWEQWRAAEGLAKKDTRNDLQRWKLHIESRLGALKVADIAPRHINKLKSDLAHVPGTANRCISLLSVMMTFAVANGYRRGCAPEHPIKGRVVKRNKETPSDFYFTSEQLGRLLEAADADANKSAGLMIRLLALTGARFGEVARSHWGQFTERSDGRLNWTVERTNTKTGEPYTRTLDGDLSRRLREWRTISLANQRVVPLKPTDCESQMAAPLWVFPLIAPQKRSRVKASERTTARALPTGHIHTAWRRIKKAAGVSTGRIHDLRHTVATAIVRETGSLEAAKRQLGHATIATTQRYAHHVTEVADHTSDILANHALRALSTAHEAKERSAVVSLRGSA